MIFELCLVSDLSSDLCQKIWFLRYSNLMLVVHNCGYFDQLSHQCECTQIQLYMCTINFISKKPNFWMTMPSLLSCNINRLKCTVLIESIHWSHITGIQNQQNSEWSQVIGACDETSRYHNLDCIVIL